MTGAEAPPPLEPAVVPLPPDLRERMVGTSWHEGCPVALDDLRLVHVRHHGPDGEVHRGALVVAESVAAEVEAIFRDLLDAGFPITRIEPVSAFGGDDLRSMAADNTSGFNCRRVTGGSAWSEHSHGTAIDLNPLRNPYVRGDRVLPPEGRAYLARDPATPGVIVPGDAVVTAFAARGWKWGGAWRSAKDWQHFSKSGR